jgi:hypothetical protein
MKRLQEILSRYKFSPDTIRKVKAKKTEKGAINFLNSWQPFTEAFPDDESVFQMMFEAQRKNANNMCICGASISHNYIRDRKRKLKCIKCRRRINPLAHSPLKRMHFDLDKFLWIAYWSFNSKQGCTTAEISRQFDWKYDTALPLHHRMNRWMGQALDKMNYLPGQPVEVDEVHPPTPDGLPKGVKRTRGTGSEGIESYLVMAGRSDKKKGIINPLVKVKYLPEITKDVIQPIFLASIAVGSEIFSDGAKVYNYLNEEGVYKHRAVNHTAKIWVDGEVHNNTAEGYNSIAKNKVINVHRGVGEIHLTGYMDSAAWMLTHRRTGG